MVTVGSGTDGCDGGEGFLIGWGDILVKWFSCGFGYCLLLALDATVVVVSTAQVGFAVGFPMRF
jgi:hypothetical protein